MPDLPRRKVGIVACSGEELAEGTVTRLAALRVLEQLRPADTVTICLPLFLAGGEGDRAFARFYPTIAVDGCDQQCAARATERHSGRPAAAVIVTEMAREHGLGPMGSARRLGEPGRQAVGIVADHVAGLVDALLAGHPHAAAAPAVAVAAPAVAGGTAACACAAAIPTMAIEVGGRSVMLAAMPLVFDQFREAGKEPGAEVARELLAAARIYNDLPAATDADYLEALGSAYAAHCSREGSPR